MTADWRSAYCARVFYAEARHDAVIWRTQNVDAGKSRKILFPFFFLVRRLRAISSA